MNTRALVTLCAALICASAADEKPAASISGTVEDSVTGQALEGVHMSFRPNRVEVQTDVHGSFEFKVLAAGTYVLDAWYPCFGPGHYAVVTLNAGQAISGITLKCDPLGQIQGKITDENSDPLPGATIRLVTHEYYKGALRLIIAGDATANDLGAYTIDHVRPNYPYLLMAEKKDLEQNPISKQPLYPKLRKKAFAPAYYGGSDNPAGSQALRLRPGERMEAVDFQLHKETSFCIDGDVRGPAGANQAMFSVGREGPRSGFTPSTDSGSFSPPHMVQTGVDGKMRVCGLRPDEYEITAYEFYGGVLKDYGKSKVAITNSDVHNVIATAQPPVTIDGELVWDVIEPGRHASGRATVALQPLTRAYWMEEKDDANPDIPGKFTLTVPRDDYVLHAYGTPQNSYVKSATYGGSDVLMNPLRAGAEAGNTLRIVLAHDGGTIHAKAVDKDGNAVPSAQVIVVSADAATEAALAGSMLRGSTDQNGNYTAGPLAPGKYVVFATFSTIDFSAERMSQLWLARGRGTQANVPAGGDASVTVAVAPIE